MLRIQRSVRLGAIKCIRKLSDQAEKAVAIPATSAQSSSAVAFPKAGSQSSGSAKAGGSTFIQRFVSFLAGCGVGFGTGMYFVYNQLVESNEVLLRNIKQIEASKGK
jgi:hypothetical protein